MAFSSRSAKSSPVSTALAESFGLSKGQCVNRSAHPNRKRHPPTFVDGLQGTECVQFFRVEEGTDEAVPLHALRAANGTALTVRKGGARTGGCLASVAVLMWRS